MQFILLIIILIFLIIIILLATRGNNPNFITIPQIATKTYPLILYDLTFNDKLLKYCESWGYNYSRNFPINEINQLKSGYILFLNEPISDINYEYSLELFMNIGQNLEYIAFDNSNNYFLHNSYNISLEDIKQDINNVKLSPSAIKDIFDTGFPILTKRGIILNKAYIDHIFHNRKLSFKIPFIMPNKIQKRYLVPNLLSSINDNSYYNDEIIKDNTNKIPKIIHQTFQTRFLPECIATAAYSWINKNSDYEYRYYDDNDRRRFIESHFDKQVVDAYNLLIPGAYKADLWRYCVIYIKGGVYVDIKTTPLVPLNKIIDDDTDLLVTNDTHDGTLYNAFFAASPKHPAILETISTVVKRVVNKEYGNHILYPTGPLAMGHAILNLYNYEKHIPNGKHITKNGIIQVYSHTKCYNKVIIVDINGKELINTRHPNVVSQDDYIQKTVGLPHYSLLWNNKMIYNE